MWNKYFKYSWRNITKNKTFSLLNITGLVTGLICFIFIALWVKDELSYDKFNRNYDRIYRLTGIAKTESGITEAAVSSAPMADALKNDYAEVESTVRLDLHEEIVQHSGQQFLQPGILLTDPSFFKIFSYRLIAGNVSTALNEPFSVILTSSAAKKYFGESDPMGQELLIYMQDSSGRGAPYRVTGIMPDPPGNAHFDFTMLASFKTVETVNPAILTADGWGDASFYTYLLLKEGVDYKKFSNKIAQFYEKYIGDLFETWRSIYSYKLQPLRDIHLRSHLQYEIGHNGDIKLVYIFSTIGIFILLLAAINYMNLATARSVERAREVGIKKVVGAGKSQLVIQYLSEAVILVLIALASALLLAALFRPVIQQISGKDLSPFNSPALLVFLSCVAIFLGIISGLYPALIISGFKPVRVLKGSFRSGSKGVILRKSLVMAQFTITLVLITGIIVIRSQMSFIKNRELGFDNEALLALNVNGNSDVINGYESFRNDLVSSPLITGVTASNSLPVGGFGSGGSETIDMKGNPIQVTTARLRVDPEYLGVYRIELVAGSDFRKSAMNDSIRPVLLNEAAVKKFGWQKAENAVGRPFRIGNRTGFVTGVVRNFHFNSLQRLIEPLAIYPLTDRFSRITVRTDIGRVNEATAWVEKTWKSHFPGALFDYDFLDRKINDQYQAERRFSKLFSGFSVLSLLIACLGLYGLIAYSASQRTKEIGVRKVMGATVKSILVMLFKDYMKPVALAFVISIPVVWYVMNIWLRDFAYRSAIAWWMFASAGILVMMIALITVSLEAFKAAFSNPVGALRSE